MAGDPVSSAFLRVVFQTTAGFLMQELKLERNIQDDVQRLKKNVDMIRSVLSEAEKKNPSPALKKWLDDLRDVGYEAMDLLDEHSTELLRQNLVPRAELRNKLSPVNPKRAIQRHVMSDKIKEVSLKLDKVFQMRNDFGLNISEVHPKRNRLETTTSLPPTFIVGREYEKSAILCMLIPPRNVQIGDPKLSVFAIHGMGRIGKTTLAQLIYNDKTLMHFDMRLWVHVSYEFDLEKVTRSILDSMDEQCSGINLDTSQRRIQEKLQRKRFLLVLDDVWTENQHEWEKLVRPLHIGAPGSVIIVTTRTRLVAELVSTHSSYIYPLNMLSENDCYSLVSQYASRNDKHACAKLKEMRSEIIKNCSGMPEEAIGLGDQLRREDDIEKWNEIVIKWGWGHKIPKQRDVFISSMILSYYRLPSKLKPCFTYCSIIPKGLQFEKEWLVQLWMSQSFIIKQDNQSIEDTGNTYIDWLVERSFMQRTRTGLYRDQYEYSIPDMVHETAKHISAKECYIFEFGKTHNLITSTIRHMSIVYTREQLSCNHDPFPEFRDKCEGLYTLLVIGGYLINYPLRLPNDLSKGLGRLRTLDLSYCNLAPLPTNIGDLIHLRYLQLRNSNIQELPESVGNLYNLQTLGLRNCWHLRKLPKNIGCLRKLLHLDLHLDSLHPNADQMAQPYELQSMPQDIGLLTNLEVLSRFVVSMRNNCDIGELRNLNSLREELSILNLDLVVNPNDATIANLQEKKYIKRLQFFWRVGGNLRKVRNQGTTKMVLERLKPSSMIKELNIVGYTGENFPSWLETSYLCHLHSIILSDCPNSIVLPSLRNLPMLQNLHIKGMPRLKSIDYEFCGNNLICFPSLQKLVIENMASLEKWSANDNCKLPHLNELVLKDCAKLQKLTHNFPSLTKLMVQNLPEYLGLRMYPSLKYLEVAACDNWIWRSWRCLSSIFSLTLCQLSLETLPADLPTLDSLQRLEISHCPYLIMLPDYWIPSGVTSLCIRQCPMLRELPKGLETLKSLEDLEIQDCQNLKFLPEIRHLKVLTRLVISGCHSFEYLPRQGLPDALNFLSISDCPLFSVQFGDSQSPDHIKIKHVFSVWIDHKLFPSTPGRKGEPSDVNYEDMKGENELHVQDIEQTACTKSRINEEFLTDRNRGDKDTKSLEKNTSADLHHEWATQIPTDGSSFVYGRQNDKEKIIETVNQSAEEDHCTVIFVIAAPGVGKTTLARVVYNDRTISDSFDATIFVTLSESYDEKQIMKVTIEGITQTSCDMVEKDLLETVIREEFSGKKILVVLDDAQDVHKNGLLAILGHLNVAAKGSVVLVNTNSKSAIAEYLGVKTLHYYYLNPLPETCCWEIFKRTAFQGRDPFALAGSVWICKKLVSMCAQNLLCLKFISGLMRNLDHEQWSEVLDCDSWGKNKFGRDTLPALRVCYDYLPPHLKKCFSYFSLFPENYIFKKDEVIYLWLSQGCIEHKEGKELENIGGEYFDELVGRFFIEESPDHSEGRFVMHAKICDLAKHVSVNGYFSSEDPMQIIPENTRHFSFVPCEYQTLQMKHMITEARDLQSFLVLSRSSWDPMFSIVNLADLSALIRKFRNLKTLYLNNTAIEELPDSIGSLENLLYLGLSNTRIRSLPSEISCLTNLQTLEAANCYYLHELPETIKELVNLRHLDITKEWDYVRIPVGIGSLSNLRSLPSFNVGSDILQSTIGELKGLELLRGSLQILGLENIPNEIDAKQANLAGKLYLENVSLQWSPSIEYTTEDNCEEILEMVLENLQPCYSIHELVIRNYMGSKFPMWMGDVFYSQLESVILDNCPSCEMFPSLGGLPRLKYLSVQKLYGVREMRALGKFPSLKLLNLWEMHDLELFEVNMGDFPCIQTLSINRCHKLKSIPYYPSLVDLSLHFSSRVPDIPELPSLEFLKIEGFRKIEVLNLPTNLPMLKNVQIVDCSELLSLKGIPQLASIEKLQILKCPKLDLKF